MQSKENDLKTETEEIRQGNTKWRKVNITARYGNQFYSSLNVKANLFRLILFQPERVNNVTELRILKE